MRGSWRIGRVGAVVALVWAGAAWSAETPDGAGVLAALEQAIVRAATRAEKSVVVVGRIARPTEAERELVHPTWTDPTDPQFTPTDVGSGVVIDPDGLILTNEHVVAAADPGRPPVIWVHLSDGRRLVGRVWAADPRSDLAVVKVPAKGLVPIRMGDGGRVRRGQIVLALGNPFGSAHDGRVSVSWGIVSNLSRRQPASEPSLLHYYGTLIQTDARLNVGTSGGALVNIRGEMVGLTTALGALGGVDEGVGYAIPIDARIKAVVETLKQGREVQYGFLGIVPSEVKPSTAAPRGGTHGTGVLAQVVDPTAPAGRGGMKAGDVILRLDGRAVHTTRELVLMVGAMPVGHVCRVDVMRDGRPVQLEVTLGKYPVAPAERVVASRRPPDWRGLRVDVRTAYPRLERRLRYPKANTIVTVVSKDSPADAGGLRPGMLVLQVGSKPVGSPAEFYRLVGTLKGEVVVQTDQGRCVIKEK